MNRTFLVSRVQPPGILGDSASADLFHPGRGVRPRRNHSQTAENHMRLRFRNISSRVAVEPPRNHGDQYAKDNLHIDRRSRYSRRFCECLLCGGKWIEFDRRNDGHVDEHDGHEHRRDYRDG